MHNLLVGDKRPQVNKNIFFTTFTLRNKWGWIKWLTPLPLEREVKGSILIPYKAGGPFLPLVEPEAVSLPLVGVGLSTSQPPLDCRRRYWDPNPWKTV